MKRDWDLIRQVLILLDEQSEEDHGRDPDFESLG